MSKFAGAAAAPPASPIRTVPGATTTFEGGAAVGRDTKSELFLLAATNMVGEDTFYEAAGVRDQRYRTLIDQVSAADPGWVARFVPYLRGEMNMRSASVVMAAEFAHARLSAAQLAPLPDGVTVRSVVRSALQRPDEPAELLGYWRSRYGRAIPKPIKRAIGDYLRDNLSERAAIKYDGQGRAYRLGDVIEVCHPQPTAPWQGQLFRWLLDRRQHADDLSAEQLSDLPVVQAYEQLRLMDREAQRAALLAEPRMLDHAGVTWEHLAGLGPMDAAAWEAVIPQMGYMALLRNLRNFEQAGISNEALNHVVDRLADPEQVARSRQFPYRFLSAYRASGSHVWSLALEKALQHATANVPELPGRTLVLTDTSASMQDTVSGKSVVRHVDVAALFSMVTALRNPGRTTLVGFADGAFEFQPPAGASVLRQVDTFDQLIGSVGHGTQMLGALEATYRGHDRVVIFSDLQCAPYLGVGGPALYGWGSRRYQPQRTLAEVVPAGVPVYAVNTAGYAATPVDSSRPGFYEVGGFSDRLFTMIAMLDKGTSVDWPF